MKRLRNSSRASSMNGTSSTTRPARETGSSHGAIAFGISVRPFVRSRSMMTGVALGAAGFRSERHQQHDETGARDRLQPRRDRVRNLREALRAVALDDDRRRLGRGRLRLGLRRLALDLALGLGGRALHRVLRALDTAVPAYRAD